MTGLVAFFIHPGRQNHAPGFEHSGVNIICVVEHFLLNLLKDKYQEN